MNRHSVWAAGPAGVKRPPSASRLLAGSNSPGGELMGRCSTPPKRTCPVQERSYPSISMGIASRLSDTDLTAALKRLAQCEREATAVLIAHLAEFDDRRLYLGAGFSSMFTYCTHVLGLSEQAAFHRIQAARAARAFPLVLEVLGQG